LSTLLLPSLSQATPKRRVAEAPTTEARQQYTRGLAAFERGDYVHAEQAFRRADQLHPAPALAYNLGRTYELQHRLDDALHSYRDYLRRAPHARDRAAVEARIRALAARLATQATELRSLPSGATVWVDGEPIGRTPLTVEMASGPHQVSFKLAGHQTQSLKLALTPSGQPVRVEAVLPPERRAQLLTLSSNPQVAETTRERARTREDGDRSMRDVGFVAMLGSVTALGGALGFEILRANTERSTPGDADPQRGAQQQERAQTQKTIARILAGAGGGLAALGITLLVLSREPSEEQPRSRVALRCGAIRCSAELQHTF
jgi:tetratricopeptide (TPR) repeat protein